MITNIWVCADACILILRGCILMMSSIPDWIRIGQSVTCKQSEAWVCFASHKNVEFFLKLLIIPVHILDNRPLLQMMAAGTRLSLTNKNYKHYINFIDHIFCV